MRIIRVKSGSITHTRPSALAAASAGSSREQQFRLGQVLAAQVHDRAAGQGRLAGQVRSGQV